jgi:hypothetical protein
MAILRYASRWSPSRWAKSSPWHLVVLAGFQHVVAQGGLSRVASLSIFGEWDGLSQHGIFIFHGHHGYPLLN